MITRLASKGSCTVAMGQDNGQASNTQLQPKSSNNFKLMHLRGWYWQRERGGRAVLAYN